MLFKLQDNYYFLPFALDGTIYVYGQFMSITPLPFGGGTTNPDDKKVKPWIPGMNRKPVYDPESVVDLDPDEYCVILNDYTPQLS
jgi:hypothetical protein